jgi:hypothetical protein
MKRFSRARPIVRGKGRARGRAGVRLGVRSFQPRVSCIETGGASGVGIGRTHWARIADRFRTVLNWFRGS